MHLTWPKLIDASTAEIVLWARTTTFKDDVSYYAKVLAAYLQNETEVLRKLYDQCLSDSPVKLLVGLRLQIREQNLNSVYLTQISEVELPGVLEAEKNFSLGVAWEACGNDRMAHNSFVKGFALYRAHDCPRKSLRAFYNSVAADSRIFPYKSFVGDYQTIIELSRNLKELSFEGMALCMLSREYQMVGVFDKALEMVTRAIDCLESERGTIHYYHALLHKAHVLKDLGRHGEILPLLKESELATFPAIRAARCLIEASISETSTWDPKLEADLLPTWRNRMPALLPEHTMLGEFHQLSTLEEQLLRLIYNGPIEKWELIERIYPEKTDPLVLENRFKALLARLRKKYPEDILCINGRYSTLKMTSNTKLKDTQL